MFEAAAKLDKKKPEPHIELARLFISMNERALAITQIDCVEVDVALHESQARRLGRRHLRRCPDGNIELTNNRVERELRKLVLGRRKWLFAWEDLGGERTAHILTIVGTCVAHCVNPRAYLHLVTNLTINGWPQAKLRDLLPDRLAVAYPDLVVREPPTALPAVPKVLPPPPAG